MVPLQINEILEAPEEGFLVEGQEVGMMVIVGKVMDCEKATTKTTYKVSRIINMIMCYVPLSRFFFHICYFRSMMKVER